MYYSLTEDKKKDDKVIPKSSYKSLALFTILSTLKPYLSRSSKPSPDSPKVSWFQSL